MKSIRTLALLAFLALTLTALESSACPCDGHNAKDAQVSKAPMAFDKMPAVGTKATCPVSKEEFTVEKDTPKSEYKGKVYVFCCGGCKPKFDADPDKYLSTEGGGCSHKGDCPCKGKGDCPCKGKGDCPCKGKGDCPCKGKGDCPCKGTGDCPCKGKCQKDEQAPKDSQVPMAFDKMPAVGTKAVCPVSKREFTVEKETPKSEYKGKVYVFCCGGCKPQFDANPAKFVSQSK